MSASRAALLRDAEALLVTTARRTALALAEKLGEHDFRLDLSSDRADGVELSRVPDPHSHIG